MHEYELINSLEREKDTNVFAWQLLIGFLLKFYGSIECGVCFRIR